MSPASLPIPPGDLAARVGTPQGYDPVEFYLAEGARLRGVIESLLPADWTWEGMNVLDFGCGSARVLRHFEPEARRGAFWGCDIDLPSIEWNGAHLSPPFRFFGNGPAPPLTSATASFDLIWATSVFTHIGDLWSAWLAEMHRVLAPAGILIASFLGEGMWEALAGEPYREDQIGMSVMHHWEGSDAWVFHSEWWLREHWGRAFEVIDVQRPPRTDDGSPQITHSYIALRRLEVPVSTVALERIDGDHPRELAALQTSLRLAYGELAELAERQPGLPGSRRHLRRAVRLARRLGVVARRQVGRVVPRE
jgi:SAM-dependent methyltransferase